MRRVAVLFAAVAALCAGLAFAQSPRPVGRPMVVTTPDWLRHPTLSEIDAVYPRRARRLRLSGAAVIRCRVSAGGAVSDCAVLMAAPPGQGFGEAAIALAHRTPIRPRTVDGRPRDGGVLTREVRFSTGSGPPYVFNFQPGDAAALLTPIASRGRLAPGRGVACPGPGDPERKCRLHAFDWAERPQIPFHEQLLKRTDQRSGVSLMDCGVVIDGRLDDCTVGGEATAGSRAVLLALAPGFRTRPKARDGTPMTSGRVLIEVDWKILTGGPEPGPLP